MLELQFILTYQNTDYQVDEPDGFKNFNSILERDFDTHGVFFRFTEADLKLKFSGTGRTVLQSARDTFGVDASVDLTVKRRFRSTDTFTTIYTGSAAMENIEIDRDYASVDFEEINQMIKIRDRLDVPVSLDATEDLDGNAISAATSIQFAMGAKTIQKISNGTYGPDAVNGGLFVEQSATSTDLYFNIQLPDISFVLLEGKNEIEYKDKTLGFSPGGLEIENVSEPEFFYWGGSIEAIAQPNQYSITISLIGFLDVQNIGSTTGRGTMRLYLHTFERAFDGTYSLDTTELIDSYDFSSLASGATDTWNISYSSSKTITNETKRYRIYADLFYAGTSGDIDISVGTSANSDITFQGSINTSEPETDVTGYFIHEALRHSLEVVTGSNAFLHAPFIGRTADGYAENGCAWNYAETNGWKVRGFSNSVISSLKNRLESLKNIFGLGYGVERTGAGGSYRMRLDTYDYWYNQKLLYQFDDVVEYKEMFDEWFAFNEVEVGYKTYITDEEEPGSVEDFNSYASWVLPVNKLRKKMKFISNYIASDLLAEITRRIQFDQKPTTSYKYDDDLYLNEIKSDGAGGWEIGTDKNDVLVNNINPLYNTLINPKFNFFNHYLLVNSVTYRKSLTDTYRNTFFKNGGDLKIYYSSLSATDNCLGDINQGSPVLTNLAPTLKNNVTLSRYRNGKRLFDPIKITFKTALSTTQVDNIVEAHRNGLQVTYTVTLGSGSGQFAAGQTVTEDGTGISGTVDSYDVVGGVRTAVISSATGVFTPGNLLRNSSTDVRTILTVTENNSNNGFFRVTTPDGDTVDGWLLKLTFNYADEIGTFELIKKAEEYLV